MEFHEFAQLLYPHCGDGKSNADFVVALFDSIIEESATIRRCPILDFKPEYLKRIYNGKKPIIPRHIVFATSHMDKERFESYIETFSVDALQGISVALAARGISTNGTDADIAEKCADLFAGILTGIVKGDQGPLSRPVSKPDVTDALNELDELLASFPKPPEIATPDEVEEHEQPYIFELYAAYGDAEGLPEFDASVLKEYGQYDDDLKDRRIDYFAAESIRRGVSEVYDGRYADQFDVLKNETLAGVVNTARRGFANGYERLLAVMEQAAVARADAYFLSRSPYWISNKIKMGICHFLVNDGKLKWVPKNG